MSRFVSVWLHTYIPFHLIYLIIVTFILIIYPDRLTETLPQISISKIPPLLTFNPPPPTLVPHPLHPRFLLLIYPPVENRQMSGGVGSSSGSQGDDNNNNNNNNNEPNAEEERINAEEEMKEKILSAQLAGWRNTCDALIAKFEKADALRKAVVATNKELKNLLKSGNNEYL